MMGLIIEVLILGILILILITLFIDEKRLRATKSSTGKLTGYWDGTERRRSVRINIILNIKYSIDKKHPKNGMSLSKNISKGGVLIQLNEKLFPPTPLLMDIILPDGQKSITVKGHVVWIRELPHSDETGRKIFDAGIKFVSLSAHDKERLNKHVVTLIQDGKSYAF